MVVQGGVVACFVDLLYPDVSGAKMAPLTQESLSMAASTARRRPVDPGRSRISARVPTGVQARLLEAAELVGATVNQFVLQAALREADRVIEHERVIAPSARDAKMILDLLDKPRAPNAKLRAALKRYRGAFGVAADRAVK
jgi:uncharacterized protein (DUF1778 family)